MNYELAKQLKEAGFPFKDWNPYYSQEKDGIKEIGYNNVPTLSELIEECVDDFSELVRDTKENLAGETLRWLCYPTNGGYFKYKDHSCEIGCCGYIIGSTPEEAVAKLWLEINKK